MTAYLPVPPERSIINIPPDEPRTKWCDLCGLPFPVDEEGEGRILCDECGGGDSAIACWQCGEPTVFDDVCGGFCRLCVGEGD